MQSQLVLGTLDRITGIDDLAINEIVTNQPTRHSKRSTRRQPTRHQEVNSLPTNDTDTLTLCFIYFTVISWCQVGWQRVDFLVGPWWLDGLVAR